MADLTTDTDVLEYLGDLATEGDPAHELSDADKRYLERTVTAVNSWLGDPDTGVLDQPASGAEWPAHLKHGATMMAATVWRRRATPDGVAAFGDLTAFVQRHDPDANRLLGIGPYRIPKVG